MLKREKKKSIDLVLGLELLDNICETRHSAQCVKTTLQKNYPAKTKAGMVVQRMDNNDDDDNTNVSFFLVYKKVPVIRDTYG